MAGKIHKFQLFQPWVLVKHLPDWRTLRRFAQHFVFATKDRKDDTLLMAVVDEFASGGIVVLSRDRLCSGAAREIRSAHAPRPDAGRTQGHRVRLEHWPRRWAGSTSAKASPSNGRRRSPSRPSKEPTRASSGRGQLCRAGGFTVVKVAKPQQDMRFDVPTIGLGTLETMTRAGASCLAIEAGRTIILDEPQLIEYADRASAGDRVAEQRGSISARGLTRGRLMDRHDVPRGCVETKPLAVDADGDARSPSGRSTSRCCLEVVAARYWAYFCDVPFFDSSQVLVGRFYPELHTSGVLTESITRDDEYFDVVAARRIGADRRVRHDRAVACGSDSANSPSAACASSTCLHVGTRAATA